MNSPAEREEGARHRAGYVAIVGRPNVGKSTLLNRMVGQKVSIVSRKPQTTRLRITGIVSREHAQIVFVDTPGYQTAHRSTLNRIMNRAVAAAVEDVDAALWVVRALQFDSRDAAIGALLAPQLPVVIAINQIDRLEDRSALLPFIAQIAATRAFAAIVPVSAKSGNGVEALVGAVDALLPEGPPPFEADEITTVNERVLAAEILREKLFRLLGEEVPYGTAVEIEKFETTGGLRRIHAVVLVGKQSQKGMVIGKAGAKLKEVATQGRQDMERLFGGKVFLELWVKVRKGWADDETVLKRLGYTD
jgi:GTP-binding protein Era